LGRDEHSDWAAMSIRIGQGVDIHRVSDDPARAMVLGGVRFDGPGLVGHSDADVVAHAVTDALLAAAGLGDIGQQFPDTDPSLEGADSMVLLEKAVVMVVEAGWQAVNVDCTVIADFPKLAPRRDEMQAGLTRVVGAPVTVKGRRTEGVGSLGAGDAVVALAVALVEGR
jgi:2-C-methyl-D-erythritol 2,4-cyclodiphosphate synthase